ncbi:helix-hairpin-helix domain-containing protein [Butyrivibrio sp. AC2005]|uniref:helix-hairpin-helix domain-containing protein n=1 Tax=Butyrivibrio sp. AC2005 TaxID=1280672 RepID=UPI0004016124|nr:helix-hairpin-helix domain-containing protein [Butyrivibrio sp. AC2005]
MQKHITKKFITLLLMGVLLTGCAKKSTDIVLTDPVMEEEAAENADSSKSEGNDDATKSEESVVTDAATGANITDNGNAASEISVAAKVEEPTRPETIMVHVCGAVLCEGVYELPAGSRVVDAIKAAGGFMQDADSEFVNQALILEDGVKIKIPTTEETLTAGTAGVSDEMNPGSDTAGITGMSTTDESSSSENGGKVNINTATESELCTIPGIGPGRAKNIISYREEKGKFGTIEDIKKVSGIKDKFFSKIKDHITV